jgi:diacylglycerol kinase (ATP)
MTERDGLFCLVVNPAAGNGRSLRLLPEVTALLDAAGAAYAVSRSASLDDARDIAAGAARQGHTVVAVGGDGLAGALSGVAASAGARYGIIPAGSGNNLARVLGIPPGTAAARVLTMGRERRVGLIAAGVPGQAETVVAGRVHLGVPSVTAGIASRARRLRGPAAYPVAALRALASRAQADFRVEVRRGDRGHAGGGALVRDFAGSAVVVANSAYFGAGLRVAPPAELDDGMLGVLTMRHGPRPAFLRTLMKIGSQVSLISMDRGTEVTVTAGRDLPAAADGEALPWAAPLRSGTPLRVRVLPGVLRALVPPSA